MTSLCFEDFRAHLDTTFALADAGVEGLYLTLKSAAPLPSHFAPAGARAPFSLMFQGNDESVLPQRIYRLRHEGLGQIDIFLVPTAKSTAGTRYEATFN